MEDTICAISTAVGVGGISIIRVSGNNSIKLVNSIFKGKDLTKVDTNTINYGHIIYNDEIIDEVLISIMRAPKTYTKEDIVEINSHGGIAVTNKILEILLTIGCREAEPGEFTKRAFLNGRIDLVEAESVIDVINAETENARSLSVNNLTGKLSNIIKEVKQELLSLEANIEVNIDYPEYEDIEDITNEKAIIALKKITDKFDKLIEESKSGKIIKNGLDVAIIGAPNVGKSSILNALLEENKAIVTDIEGTTRDIVEGRIILNGIMINFIDTAGIRETKDVVEKIGVDKSLEKLDEADLVILVLDGSRPLKEEEKELLNKVKTKNHIIFINKNDLNKKINIEGISGNAKETNGLDDLKKAIIKELELNTNINKDMTYISNARQLSLIKKADNSLKKALKGLQDNIPVDVITIDIESAKNNLGEILGENYKDDLLDELFSRFCIGK